MATRFQKGRERVSPARDVVRTYLSSGTSVRTKPTTSLVGQKRQAAR
jgi:hypothetical protein